MTMLAIIDSATNALLEVVPTLDGTDMTGRYSLPVPEGYNPEYFEWDAGTSSFVDMTLARAQARAIARVNAEAEAAYGPTLLGPIGSALYPIKEAQARAWAAAESPTDADYLLPYAEVGITGATMAEVVGSIIAKADAADAAREAAAVLIEPVRQQAQIDIINAETAGAVDAVLAALVWPDLGT